MKTKMNIVSIDIITPNNKLKEIGDFINSLENKGFKVGSIDIDDLVVTNDLKDINNDVDIPTIQLNVKEYDEIINHYKHIFNKGLKMCDNIEQNTEQLFNDINMVKTLIEKLEQQREIRNKIKRC